VKFPEAEEITLGWENVTSGASSAIEQATRIARALVTLLGLSRKMDPLVYGAPLGHSVTHSIHVEATLREVDAEIRFLVEEGHEKVHAMMKKHSKVVEAIVKALLEYETISGKQVATC